jgi:hypothetical protein
VNDGGCFIMSHVLRWIPLLVGCLVIGASLHGCAGTQGNRRPGRPLIDRVADLHGVVGKTATLVGTAGPGGPEGVTLAMRGGSVELPAYQWPAGFVGQTVLVTGTVIDSHVVGDPKHGMRVYRLGEIEDAHRSSR